MKIRDMRAAISQARFNDQYAGLLHVEAMILSVSFAFFAMRSWWALVICCFGSWYLLRWPRFRFIFARFCVLIWAAIGWSFGYIFDSLGANFFFAGLVFIFMTGAHLAAIEWIEDINRTDED